MILTKHNLKRRGFYVIQSPQSSNYYYISENHKESTLISPALRSTIEAFNGETNSPDAQLEKLGQDKDYYAGLYDFLKQHNFFEENIVEKMGVSSGSAGGSFIEHNIANCGNVTFEVTDSCNLNCKYCGYGDLYLESSDRGGRNLPFITAKRLLDFFFKLKNSKLNRKRFKKVHISFYGGEGLLNFDLIQKIVKYVKNKIKYEKGDVGFRLTTNGVLLNESITQYLVENRFDVRISLDGNKDHNGYRVFLDGTPSFDVVYNNIRMIQRKWPEYFSRHVNFASVIHRKNSAEEVEDFFRTNFEKAPIISELSMVGVRPDKMTNFKQLHKKAFENLLMHSNKEKSGHNQRPPKQPLNIDQLHFVLSHTKNIALSYLKPEEDIERSAHISTGTCSPFSRKIFCTVEGKLLPCEKIPQSTFLAAVNEEGVEIDYKNIVKKYQEWNRKLCSKCNSCFSGTNCMTCLFHLSPDSDKTRCRRYESLDSYTKKLSNSVETFERFPDLYKQLLTGD